MNTKKVNWLFLTLIVSHILFLLVMILFRNFISMGIVCNLLIGQAMIFFPTLGFLIFKKVDISQIIKVKKIHISTGFMIVLFTYLTMPLVVMVNSISMLFTDNVVAGMSNEIIETPFLLIFFLMAILGPINEELILRGVIYEGYKKSSGAFLALITSSILFGLIHMNLNQALYAAVIGIMFILLKEATGSILAPIISHMVFNGHSVVLLFLTKDVSAEVSHADIAMISNEKEMMVILICITAVIAVISTSLSFCVLAWISNKEGRKQEVMDIWKKRKENKNKIITIPLVIGVIICLVIMIRNL